MIKIIDSKQTFRVVVRWINGIFFILLVSLMALSSCADDDIDRNRPITPPNPEDPNADVLFEINMPQTLIPSRYKLMPEDENNIQSIEVLLFKINGTSKEYTGTPYYCDKVEDTGGNNASKKKFSISLPKGGPYEIVILANSRQMVNDALVANAPTETQKDEVLALLKMEHTGKWISDANDGSYKAIPMWGEVGGGKTISENLKFNAQLMRMLAKIDVEITATAQNSFKLTAVHLIKANTQGHIVPTANNLDGGKATAPTLVTGSSTSATVLTYPVVAGATELKSEIYTFEAIKATTGRLTTATCVVLQGEFNSDGNVENYYRLDFGTGDGATVNYLDLLRNFKYDIKVTKVSGTGQPTLDNAILYPSTNIVTELTVWNNSEFPVIIFDNTYSLGFSSDDIVRVYKPSTNNILKIMTDYPGGWVVDPTIEYEAGSGSGWLAITTPLSGSVTTPAETKFNLTVNGGDTPRICYILVSAGPLRHKVKVTQNPAIHIGRIVWDDYDGTNTTVTNDGDANFTSISILDSDGFTYTPPTPAAGPIPTPVNVKGDIEQVTVVYQGHTLVLTFDKYDYSATTQTLTIKDRRLVAKPVHLDKVRFDLEGKYLQIKDIDLSGYTGVVGQINNWAPIGSNSLESAQFKGSYDGGVGNGGAGYKIDNLRIYREGEDHIGLFGYVVGGRFKSINITSGVVVMGQNNVGAIFGSAVDATISGCTNAVPVSATASRAGGICGEVVTGSALTNCKNLAGANIVATGSTVGGIAGQSLGPISGCSNEATVEGLSQVGGIAGYTTTIDSGVFGSFSTNTITATGGSSGGIVGHNVSGKIAACYNTGAVTGTTPKAIGPSGITFCYFGGASPTTPVTAGTSQFGGGVWPLPTTEGWEPYVAGSVPATYWADLGGWNTGGASIVYPSLPLVP